MSYAAEAEYGASVQYAANAVSTISSAITVSNWVFSINGSVWVPNSSFTPTFVNPGNVTGSKYKAQLNGVIDTQGAGVNYFPGNTAGSTSSGGQYN